MAARKKKGTEHTPLMRQYYKIKAKHPGAILMFRMGDFYETFDEDAIEISQLLGITLTKRSNGKAQDVPLAGIPHHALDKYLPQLVQAGKRVAICEQLEDPKHARKVVKRGVVEVVTPGVSFHDQILNPKRSNYLAAVHFPTERGARTVGFAFVDASTGEFFVTEVTPDQLESLVLTVMPAEVLVNKQQRDQLDDLSYRSFVTTAQEDWCFGTDFAYETLLRHFKTHSLKGFGVEDLPVGLVAAGAALYYLSETQRGKLPHVRKIARYRTEQYMALDPQTKRNLELIASMQSGGQEGTLVEITDRTQTPMGARLLRKWLVRPLIDVEQINKRLDAVEVLVQRQTVREAIQSELGQVGDLERIAARVCTARATPRELVHLRLSLAQIPRIKTLLADLSDCATLDTLGRSLTLCQDVIDRIGSTLVDDPPANLKAGGFIREGVHGELDELRTIARSGKSWIAEMQQAESERTGIPSLKVGFNKVFGYYLEVTNAHKDKVPEDFIRKQTLVNAERYITPQLKEYEEKILTAEERIGALEQELFDTLRLHLAEETAPIQQNAALLAMLDCFASFAEVATTNRYVRPVVDASTMLDLTGARHPVVEHMLPVGEPFIPNSVRLDPAEEQIMLITGPNMAGKSVVLRQVGLAVLLAQVGAFVPAEAAHIGVVDRIFTRVGASDNLAAGESTFLVEMNETANILNNASERSLILLDEVGRGTSTFDGLSIAWALVEYLHEQPRVAARTLFATHYHELNALADRLGRIRNFSIQVQEHEGKVIFLRTLVPGGADHSYGIEVAEMAGLPKPVIQRAKEILQHLESQNLIIDTEAEVVEGDGMPAPVRSAMPDLSTHTFQMSLFQADPRLIELQQKLDDLDPDRMTPIQALLALAELKRLADA
ncbi:MAG: DNA mismatch repair protein MutS [Bacteroidota bacterium]